MDKNRSRRKRYEKRSKRMGWKRKRNREFKIYLAIFLICVFIAGAITFITGRPPTLIKKTVDKQIARGAGEVLGKQLEGVDSKEDK